MSTDLVLQWGDMADEPTIADLMTELKTIRLEQRASFAELKADLATLRLDTITQLTTVFDELAAFRAEYNDHTHG